MQTHNRQKRKKARERILMNAANTHTHTHSSPNSWFQHKGQIWPRKIKPSAAFTSSNITNIDPCHTRTCTSTHNTCCPSLFEGCELDLINWSSGSCRNHISLESPTALKHTLIQLAAVTDWSQQTPPPSHRPFTPALLFFVGVSLSLSLVHAAAPCVCRAPRRW